ncbi:hypothetical protein AbraIFM66951_002213 [Aspergillus brasiliensis]|uniref:Uncharacterized protein n=1 Tax=Aspergillus brasiliensis TaxID=319629 RepID=A0A9W6DQK4_9EURO|nr:hypothetical protein AbraCBS73388_000755 [Aspergillus brasiliensis]GKZ33415.1 hypothetical protein AbraIFM66950_003271 [Aspergillus brasiliensis]GKZ49642.1 hypothetical protein AbraIFM66951_002213 [Aspergillus brasiliensis]
MPAFLKNIKNKLKSIFKKKKTEENPEGAAAPAENTAAADKPAEQAQTEGVSAAPPTLEVTETPAGEAKPETEAHAEAAAPAGSSELAAKPAETVGDAADKETK